MSSFTFESTSGVSRGFSFGVAAPAATPLQPVASPPSASSPVSRSAAAAGQQPPPPPPPTNLADGVAGVVAFPSRFGASFRFEIVAKGGELYVWLEDRATKKQWRTAQLALGDFVKEDAAIPLATFDDYAKCFLSCLEADSQSDEFSRDLVVPKHDSTAFELQLTLRIRVFKSVWTPTYTLLLKPVALTAVDLLAAKVRDQEEQIRRLEQKLENVDVASDAASYTSEPLYFRATMTSQTTTGQAIPWRVGDSSNGAKIEAKPYGVIRVGVAGTFVVNVMVNNNNSNNSMALELRVDGKTVVACIDSSANGHNHTSSIYHVVVAKVGTELSVVYRGNNAAQPGSYILIHQLH